MTGFYASGIRRPEIASDVDRAKRAIFLRDARQTPLETTSEETMPLRSLTEAGGYTDPFTLQYAAGHDNIKISMRYAQGTAVVGLL
jgi:hypothetical protein